MEYLISVRSVAEQALAVVRSEIRHSEIGVRLRPLYDLVYESVHRGEIRPGGHNVILYRDRRPGTWDTEVGIQVASPFSDIGKIVCSRTPAGEVATCTHVGPYRELGLAHEALMDWCDREGLRRTGLRWEVYGDWTADESKLRTDVFHLLEAAD